MPKETAEEVCVVSKPYPVGAQVLWLGHGESINRGKGAGENWGNGSHTRHNDKK